MTGYFEIGIYHTKTEINVGTLWRSAYQLGASGIFTIGRRYKKQSSDTVKAMTKMPLRHYDTIKEFKIGRPIGAVLIGIEMGGISLGQFEHPKNCIYILGAEDYGLSKDIMESCNTIVSLDSVNSISYNVAVAGSIVMYDRIFRIKS
jgi:tRNA G18 (ribose-2'-O)-methylase SpoU